MINLPLMNDNISKSDVESLIRFLQVNNIFTQNKMVKEFEKKWSEWLGVTYSVFVNSGSSANFITMSVLAELYGTGEVIVPPITWSSDISSVLLAGHTPVFVDVNMDNFAMNDQKILEAVTPNTKAVFLSHILGFNGLTDYLLEELNKKNVFLIEDVCESHGAVFDGKKCGSLGFVSNFSFYFAHHMSTIEGGMICTNDRKFYEYARMYRSHGMLRESTDDDLKENVCQEYPDLNPEFVFTVPGFNMRSTELNAVIGLNQMKRLDGNNKKRTENFRFFLENLNPDKYYTNFAIQGSVNYAFVLLLKHADDIMYQKICQRLREENVEFRRGTSGGGNQLRQPYLRKRFQHLNPADFPNAEFIHKYGMYIGNFPALEKEKIEELVKVLNEI
ncbi:MAG: aminotransferase class I/II-fold pyridoxal phosphate-dependent enzyme [Lachnospiraceae bacterium]|nr:aminotransferase class I/II-fold pyridoxal phosphate-dependent enzyme [Lachnospiraceae bacterium]